MAPNIAFYESLEPGDILVSTSGIMVPRPKDSLEDYLKHHACLVIEDCCFNPFDLAVPLYKVVVRGQIVEMSFRAMMSWYLKVVDL